MKMWLESISRGGCYLGSFLTKYALIFQSCMFFALALTTSTPVPSWDHQLLIPGGAQHELSLFQQSFARFDTIEIT